MNLRCNRNPDLSGRKTPTFRRGFTLLELMVVLLVLALLTSIAAPRVAKYLRRAKVGTAQIQVDALASAVDAFLLDNGRYPTADEGLNALIAMPGNLPQWDGPYLVKKESLVDPWGAPYLYSAGGAQGGAFAVYSLGSDAKTGGSDEAADIRAER